MIKPIHIFLLALLLVAAACQNTPHKDVREKEIVEAPVEINQKAEDIIRGTLDELQDSGSTLRDTFRASNINIVQSLYQDREYKPLWSDTGVFRPEADSLLALMGQAYHYGLFPEDYNYSKLKAQKERLLTDTIGKHQLDASAWAFCDLMLSFNFIQMVKDIKMGRLLADSVINNSPAMMQPYYTKQLDTFRIIGTDSFMRRLEPKHLQYQLIRQKLDSFLLDADMKRYTFVTAKDSSKLNGLIYKRIAEADSGLQETKKPDSLTVSNAIRKYQTARKIKVDGKITAGLIERLNNTRYQRFLTIALNLDRYKQLPPLPKMYLWVNIPSFYLNLMDSDTVVLTSKVVVGKPVTRTPIITSAISDMITYPKWTIPESIVKKDILPGLQRDKGYTRRKGYMVVNDKGDEIDPYTVNWSKYKDYIPYKIVQGSGDDNALGILKFNFPNQHSVYLHDTNQRYLFSKTERALSHGCVRVQSWQDLATFILRNDSLNSAKAIPVDSMTAWLERKEKHYIPVRKPIPLFIRYFTCAVSKNGNLLYFDDIYGEDRRLKDRIFANK